MLIVKKHWGLTHTWVYVPVTFMSGSRICGSFITCMNINLARATLFSCINQCENAKCWCKLKFILVGTDEKCFGRILEDILWIMYWQNLCLDRGRENWSKRTEFSICLSCYCIVFIRKFKPVLKFNPNYLQSINFVWICAANLLVWIIAHKAQKIIFKFSMEVSSWASYKSSFKCVLSFSLVIFL